MSHVVEAAEQFVDEMTDAQNAPTIDSAEGTPGVEGPDGDRRLTLEERKAKMEKLRQRMVRLLSSTFVYWRC
jgi:hypothetical protein